MATAADETLDVEDREEENVSKGLRQEKCIKSLVTLESYTVNHKLLMLLI